MITGGTFNGNDGALFQTNFNVNSCDWTSIDVNGSQSILIVTALNSFVSQIKKKKPKNLKHRRKFLEGEGGNHNQCALDGPQVMTCPNLSNDKSRYNHGVLVAF